MKVNLLILFMLCGVIACKDKQQVNKNEHPEAKELFDAYKKLKLPYHVVDSTMDVAKDSSTISLATFTKYFPDTIFNTPFGSDKNLQIHPIGKIEQNGKENYFVTYVNNKNTSAIYLSVYDSSKHVVSMPILINSKDEIIDAASIDKKLTIVKNKEWTTNNTLYYDRSIFAYNNVGLFSTVLTETNERRPVTEVANPLDTFPKKYKYSGDYVKGKKSFLFIRDSNVPNEYLFFVHFEIGEDEEESCRGELRGKFTMIETLKGQYASNGDPCLLDLTFKGNQVQVKENGSCGNYRDIKCFFNETYTKKKETKSKTTAK